MITLLIIIFELFTKFFDGKINSNDNSSGHFRPNSKSLPKVKAALDNYIKKIRIFLIKVPNGGRSNG